MQQFLLDEPAFPQFQIVIFFINPQEAFQQSLHSIGWLHYKLLAVCNLGDSKNKHEGTSFLFHIHQSEEHSPLHDTALLAAVAALEVALNEKSEAQ